MSGIPTEPNSRKPGDGSDAEYRSLGQQGTSLFSDHGDLSGIDDSVQAFQQVLSQRHPGRYQIVGELGRGGMGQVLLAIDRGPTLQSHEQVAIKRMLGPVLNNSQAVQEFLGEVEKARKLRHPNVVRMYHSENTVLGPYIVMEYIEGEDLGKYIAQHGPLPEPRALAWFAKLAGAMDEAHQIDLIHRDLKPKNILIRKDGEPILVDFGISRRMSEGDKTGTGLGSGTLEYMSPEQLENRTPKASQDIYSFGATIYHAVEGHPPFQDASIPRLIGRIMYETAPLAQRVSPAFAERIARCLDKSPERRPSSCKAIVEGLDRTRQSAPPLPEARPTKQPSAPLQPSVPRTGGRTMRWLAVAVMLSVVGLMTVWLMVSNSKRGSDQAYYTEPPPDVKNLMNERMLTKDFGEFPGTGVKEPVSPSASEKPPEVRKDSTPPETATPTSPPPSKEPDRTAPKGALDEEITNSIGMKFRLIQPGTFLMGSPTSETGRDDDETQHSVTISKPYYIGVYEVTQEEYERVMGRNPSGFKGERNPVENISWDDAVAFIERLNTLPVERLAGRVYRLPTEAEWEYACRAGTTSSYCFGDSGSNLQEYGWFEENSGTSTHPVGQKKPNNWGLFDMYGNVWEWCYDRKADYSSAAVTDPWGPNEGSSRLFRGGSWNFGAMGCRSAFRRGFSPSEHSVNLGFRLALTSSWHSEHDSFGHGNVASTSLSITNSIGMKFRLILPGTFLMGSPASESGRSNDEKQHSVTLTQPYALGIYEVTQEEYEHVMGVNPSKFKGSKNPVENISWDDAVAFIEKLNAMPSERERGRVYRLPTEAEWEYACRVGSEGNYWFADAMDSLKEYAWFQENSEGKTHSVGEKKPNAWGLYDMHGNVWEWCADWYGDYPTEAVIDPSGPNSGSGRVARGGSIGDGASGCRSALRTGDRPSRRSLNLGFRLALSSPEITE